MRAEVVDALLEMKELDVDRPAILQAALRTWGGSKADFADCIILATVKATSETPLGTFDATLGKLEGCKRP